MKTLKLQHYDVIIYEISILLIQDSVAVQKLIILRHQPNDNEVRKKTTWSEKTQEKNSYKEK